LESSLSNAKNEIATHADIDALVAMLDEAVLLLHDAGDAHWSNWLAKDAALIRRHDLYGVEHLLSAYGGMGSFNDFVVGLHWVNDSSKQFER
jgi:hypothetical protein